MSYFKIILNNGREVAVKAKNKTEASYNVVEQKILTSDDFFEISDIIEVTEKDFNLTLGKIRVDVNVVPVISCPKIKKTAVEK